MRSDERLISSPNSAARSGLITRRSALISGAAAFGAAAFGGAPALGADGTRRFAIIRDGDEIGEHTLTLSTNGDVQEMRINILIEVFFLGIRAFVYDHQNTEIWRDGQLQSLVSTTNNAGDDEFCRVERVGDRLQVQGSDFRGMAGGDRAPTSYWRKAEAPWFSSQSGKQLALQLDKSRAGAFERWTVTGDFRVTLDYDSDGEWRGCSFPASDGEIIRYRETQPGPRFNA